MAKDILGVKHILTARSAGLLCLVATLCLSASGIGAPLVVATAARTSAAKPVVLPTNAQVLAAVAAAVNVKKMPPQPAPLSYGPFGCMVYYQATSSPPCIYGDPAGNHTLVLYGDSHAANWIAAFDTLGAYLHWKVVEIAKAQCQVADFPVWNPQANRPYAQCAAFRAFAIKRIKQLRPNLVVLSSEGRGPEMMVNGRPTWNGIDAAWATGLARVIDAIRPVAGKVVVLGDFAYGLPAGKDCLPSHADDSRACNLPRSRAVPEPHNRIEQRVAQRHGALYVDTVPWFCTATVCPAVVGGLSTRDDGYHVTPNYALWLSDAMGTAIGLLPAARPT